MRIDILTLFPESCQAFLNESIMGRAQKNGHIIIRCHQIRDYAYDKHKRVDDTPYGGGYGMVMLAEPIALCFEQICQQTGVCPHFIYMSPKGEVLTQKKVKTLAKLNNIAILCGHYEGVDERLLEEFIDEQISIGDYVVSGGEMPAVVLSDAICRLVPGVLSSNECFEQESHFSGFLEHPQYTKPATWRGKSVPEVLLSGHHKNIENWKQTESLNLTQKVRPDIIKKST
jgi:tRNA (guanine37-N1)-methyltransferase